MNTICKFFSVLLRSKRTRETVCNVTVFFGLYSFSKIGVGSVGRGGLFQEERNRGKGDW